MHTRNEKHTQFEHTIEHENQSIDVVRTTYYCLLPDLCFTCIYIHLHI